MESRVSSELSLQAAVDVVSSLRQEIHKAIFGQDELVTEALCCLIGGGHILLTGAPGLAKTTLVRVFAGVMGLKFGRVQFTPDLLPSDILGSEILNVDESGRRSFEFSQGPVFVNLMLADEINRASPRTQSALLEAMQERAVTVGGKRLILPQPFLVFATQNPFESEGTFPLPEAQLDRFLMHTLVDYPSVEAERRMLEIHSTSGLVGERVEQSAASHIVSAETIRGVMDRVKSIRIESVLLNAISDLIRMTRPQDPTCPQSLRDGIWYGAGPRAGLALVTSCKAYALMMHSESVRWSHVRRMAKPVLRHRVRLASHAARDGVNEDQVIEQLLDRLQSERSNQGLGLD
jgi:MoxR-like ATPase